MGIQIRKVSAEEAATWATAKTAKKGIRKETREQYDALVASFADGDVQEVELSEDEKKLTVRNALLAAASRANRKLTFLRTRNKNGDLVKMRLFMGESVNTAETVEVEEVSE